jgi:transposase
LEEVLRLIRLVVDTDAAEQGSNPLPRRSGRPRTPLADRLKALLWQSYRSTANRPTEGELRVLELGIRHRFSYKTVERAYADRDVAAALPRLLEITNRPLRGLETIFSIDGSGFPGSVREHYRSERERQSSIERDAGYLPRGPHSWVRNLANVGVRYGLVAGWKSWTDGSLPEVHGYAEVFGQTRANHPKMTQQLGDGAFSIRALVALTTEQGVSCRFLPRRRVNLQAFGVAGWKPSLWGLVVNPQGWLSEYHLRSVSEVVWGAMKVRQPRKILKRLERRRETEATLRAVTYNLRRLAYLRWTEPALPQLPRMAG